MRILKPFVLVAAFLITFSAGLAFAQADAGTSPVNDTIQIVSQTAHDIRSAAQSTTSPKILVVLAVLLGVAQVVRRVGRKLPTVGTFNLGAWLDTHWWADWVVSLVLSLGGALTAQIASGGIGSVDTGLLVNAIVIGMAGAGFGPKADPKKVQEAGAAAAADPGKELNS